jgi:hypothetical protein
VAETDPASKLTDQGRGPIKVARMTDHAAANQPANCAAMRRVADALRARPEFRCVLAECTLTIAAVLV